MLRRIQRERHRHLAAVHPPLQFAETTDAADEIDALVGARITDAEHRRQQLCQQATSAAHRIAAGLRSGRMSQPIPPAGEIHAELAGRPGARLVGRASTVKLAQRGEECVGAEPFRSLTTRL